jgi:hypothetical protein
MAPWSAAQLPIPFRGKNSFLSLCISDYVLVAIIVFSTSYGGPASWTGALLDVTVRLPFFFPPSESFSSSNAKFKSSAMPRETVEALVDLVNLALPIYAMMLSNIYTSLIGMLFRIEAKQVDLHRPTEVQIEANRSKNALADDQSTPTDVHGRRPVALAEAELSLADMKLLLGGSPKAPVALMTAGFAILVQYFMLQLLLPPVTEIGRDDLLHRFELILKTWKMLSLTPFVVVSVSATIFSFVKGGWAGVKQLWSYTEQWGVDAQEKRRLKDLAERRKMLAAAGKGDLDASTTEKLESSEVEALLAEKA